MKLSLLNLVIPDYSTKFYRYLQDNAPNLIEFYAGTNYFGKEFNTSFEEYKKLYNVNIFGVLTFQIHGIYKIISLQNPVVLEFNPRILSNYLILICRLLLGKKTGTWGHAWSRNRNSVTDAARVLFFNLFSFVILYSETQKKQLTQHFFCFQKKISVAPNSLYTKKELQNVLDDTKSKNTIIYVGRLIPEKKVDELIAFFLSIQHKLVTDYSLLIIGDGPEKQNLRNLVSDSIHKDKVSFLGHVIDFQTLKDLYNSSLLSIIPGTAGLSLIQSLGFGVPVLVNKNQMHGPELEALKDGENGYFYTNENDLLEKMLHIIENKVYWINKRREIASYIYNHYTIENMAEPFLNIIHENKK